MKKIVIMRGMPGSGKSHYVAENYPDAYVCSADSFFERLALKEGKTYLEVFDPRMLSRAHAECLHEFTMALASNEPVVVVDNTNTQQWEYMNYVAIATALADYELEIIEVICPHDSYLEKYHARNTHGVPWVVMQDMFNRYEEDARTRRVDPYF